MKQKATFGAGCFWGVQTAFDQLDGVIETEVGYMGGIDSNKVTYEQVCTDTTGHAEVVHIIYDDKKISYEKLLETFWEYHDPTQLNRQGVDIGSQYRSAIFYYSEEQKKIAEKSLKERQKKLDRKIVTKIEPAGKFYKAEEYHQKYLAKRGLNSCKI